MPVRIQRTQPSRLSIAEIDQWRTVPVAVAVDIGGDIGQIDPAIKPLRPPGQQPRLCGRAVTASCEPPDFGAVLHAVDLVDPGDVLVIAASGNAETAMIGEILTEYLRQRGAVGVICDGAIRDVATLASWSDFSVFTRSVTARGPLSANRGAVNIPVFVGGCRVARGDLLIGDDDGLAVLSPSAVRNRILDAELKLAQEAEWKASLTSGRSARETFGLEKPTP